MKKRISKRVRAKVVELLRCAADMRSLVAAGYATGNCDGVVPCTEIYALACQAFESVAVSRAHGYYAWPMLLLETAQRVEDGWQP